MQAKNQWPPERSCKLEFRQNCINQFRLYFKQLANNIITFINGNTVRVRDLATPQVLELRGSAGAVDFFFFSTDPAPCLCLLLVTCMMSMFAIGHTIESKQMVYNRGSNRFYGCLERKWLETRQAKRSPVVLPWKCFE